MRCSFKLLPSIFLTPGFSHVANSAIEVNCAVPVSPSRDCILAFWKVSLVHLWSFQEPDRKPCVVVWDIYVTSCILISVCGHSHECVACVPPSFFVATLAVQTLKFITLLSCCQSIPVWHLPPYCTNNTSISSSRDTDGPPSRAFAALNQPSVSIAPSLPLSISWDPLFSVLPQNESIAGVPSLAWIHIPRVLEAQSPELKS